MEANVNILIVDDEPRNLEALEAILSGDGYRLLRADGADQALRVLLDHQVAAIVLDIKMPGISGFELAEIIKGSKRFRQIPIVFLTAHMLEDRDVIAGYGAGAVDYLTKPVNPQIFRHKIAVFAELFRKTRALAELNDTLEERVRQRTAELATSEAALKVSARQKDEFLATLAHELRNPLAPLRMGLDRLQKGKSTDTERTLAIMNRQVEHMVRLIDDLLDVSRISGGLLELKKERTNIAAVINVAIESSRPAFEQRRQTVTLEISPLAFAVVDPTRVIQIVGNLLHNAAKFTPHGGVIKISLTREGDNAVVRVIDSGVGIPTEQIGRVFEMFTRIERAVPHSSGGLGIGLALSRRLAEMHGGTLTAASSGVGRGSTMTLSLPAERLGDEPREETLAAVVAAIPSQVGLNIVVIEDNPDVAETLAMWLEESGHLVHVASTGPEGLDLVREKRPDLILCDVGLPGMDGVEVCTQIRAWVDHRPVMVALTGWGMERDRRRTRDAGFDHHLVKPVNPDKLRAVLQSVATLRAS